jgi:hypothetical protein
MSKDPLFIERRDDGMYAIKHANAARASALFDTQTQAIAQAKQMTTGAVHVERVRNTDVGSRDKWRKP